MAVLNFNATEDASPGSGVYKVGVGSEVTIEQADYPRVDLSSLSEKNFFKKTECLIGNSASKHTESYTNASGTYYGGRTSISYSYSGGVGTVTVNETLRYSKVAINTLDGSMYDSVSTSTPAQFKHTIYMTRNPIREM